MKRMHQGWMFEYDDQTGKVMHIQKENFAPVARRVGITFELNGVSVHNDQLQMFNLAGCDTMGEQTKLIDVKRTDDAMELTLAIGADWRLAQTYTFAQDWVKMSAALTYQGEGRQRLRNAVLDVTTGGDPQTETVFAPGYTLTQNEAFDLNKPIAKYREREILAHGLFGDSSPAYRPGMIGAHSAENKQTVCTWWDNETMLSYPAGLCGEEDGLRRHSRIPMPRFMQKGDVQRFGAFYFGAFAGSRLDAVHGSMASFADKNWDKAADYKALRQLRIMEIHIGSKAGRTVFETYDEIIEKLPEIKKLGFNGIEMMPAMPFPSYSVHDMMDVETTYKSADGLRRMIEKAHELGFKVIMDMVFHGPQDYTPEATGMPRSPYLTQDQDWFSRHESGIYARTYTRSFDLANAGYQQHIIDVMLYYLDTLGPDGFRLDAQMWNEFPNWDERTGKLPYESVTAGLRMMKDVRAAVHARYPHAIFYTEANGPMTGAYHDYRYNYDIHWAYPGLCPIIDPRGASKFTQNFASQGTLTWPDFAQWLEELQAATPKNMVIVHQTDSHDSGEWSGFSGGQFGYEAFGKDAHRVLLGMVNFCDGALMSYYGAQQDNEAYYQKLLPLRDLPVFANGNCCYTALQCDDQKTVTLLWQDGQRAAAYIGNLEGKRKTVTLTANREWTPVKEQYTARDLLTGTDLGTLCSGAQLDLAPYQTLVIELS